MSAAYRNRIVITVAWQGMAIVAIAAALSLGVNHFRPGALPLVGDWSPKTRLSDLKTVEQPVVSLEEARALFLTGGAVFIDARSNQDYLAGHIQGALNLTTDNFEENFSRGMLDIPPDSMLITYCDGENCDLSKEVAMELLGKGYPHVRVLINGWSVWQAANLPVESGGNG